MRYPPSHGCPWCGALEWSWREVSGRGAIYSYEIVVHAIQPGFREWTPYPVVLVELDEQRGVPTEHEGLRLIANLVTLDFRPEAEAQVAIGKRVRVVFQDIAENFALPQFTLTTSRPRAPGASPGGVCAKRAAAAPAGPVRQRAPGCIAGPPASLLHGAALSRATPSGTG